MKCGAIFPARHVHLHDEMLLEIDLYNGAFVDDWILVSGLPNVPPNTA